MKAIDYRFFLIVRKLTRIVSLVIFIFLLNAERSFAQFQAGLMLGPQIPVGGFASGFGAGVGFGATGKYSLSDNMAVGANLHYNSFHGKRYNDPYYNNNWTNTASITAFTGLFEYYFSTDKLKPYAGGDLGFYFWSWRWYYDWVNPAGHVVPDYHYGRGTALGIAPMAGVNYDVSDKVTLNGNLKFNLMLTESNLNYIGINIGVFYKFDK
ncbi:MAG TPA: outer membrane beta-barrel protein [Bacteroidia bacterium]